MARNKQKLFPQQQQQSKQQHSEQQQHTWVALAVGVVGAGASIYGASKSAKATKDASAANVQAQKDANAQNYQMWLESRGVGPNGEAINVKTPRWMTWNMPGQQRKIVGYRPIGSSVIPNQNGAAPQGDPMASMSGVNPTSGLPSYASTTPPAYTPSGNSFADSLQQLNAARNSAMPSAYS